MDVKEILKQHLSLFSTAPFLFVGSGVSRRYLKLETWGDLLKKFAEKTHLQYEYYFTSNNGSYPAVASSLAKEFHEIWWKDSAYQRNREKYKSFCINDESALKIEIADYLSNITVPSDEDQDLKEEIALLKQAKIDGVITTNWDLFLEEIFADFKPYIGQSELIFSVPQGIGEIYKIHGSCSAPDTLVLTEKDYKSFRERNPYLAAKLLTIFTEHPIIFIGYSLTDDNVVDIIKSITNCLTNNNIEKLRDRLIFVKYDPTITLETVEKSDLIVNSFQIPITTIEVKDFRSVFEALTQINRKFPAKLLRKLKEHVYDLVVNEKANGRLYVTDIDEATQTDEVDIVFGVGAISKIKGIGYKSVSRRDLFEDLVYEGNIFDPSKLIEETLPAFSSTTFVPMFKYLRKNNLFDEENRLVVATMDMSQDRNVKLARRINQIIEKDISHFYPSADYLKKKKYFEDSSDSIEEYITKNSFKEFLKYYTLFEEDHLHPDKIYPVIRDNFRQEIYEKPINTFDYTQFIKLICLYDYLKYYKYYNPAIVGIV